MLSEKDLIELRNERRADYQAEDAREEALAQANAYLNNVGLPSYNEVLEALAYLKRQASFSNLPADNAAWLRAAAVLARVPAYLK